MKTVVTSKVISRIMGLTFSYFDSTAEEDVEVEEGDADAIARAAEKLQCSPELIAALAELISFATDEAHRDLVSIWKRLDKLEGK